MDWQKSLLIAAMLAVVFTLIMRYSEFQETHQATTQPQVTMPSSAPGSNPLPGDSAAPVSGGLGLPSVPDDETDSAAPVVDTPAQQEAQLIRVTTDTLDLVINPRGGDIVHLALPQHYATLKTPDVPFVLLRNTDFQTYVAESGLIGPDGTDDRGRPLFTSSRSEYRLQDGQSQLVVDLTYRQELANITKRFTFTRGAYLINVEYLVENLGPNPWRAFFYGQIKRDSQDHNPSSGGIFALNPFLGPAISTNDERYKKIQFKDVPSSAPILNQVDGGWVAMVQHYFVSAWIPQADGQNRLHLRKDESGADLYRFGFTSPRLEIAPGETGSIQAGFYAGPKYTKQLEQISPYLDLTVDYGFLWWLAKPLFWLLDKIHSFVGNWGLAIIVLTIIIKAAFFKLSATSYRSMAKMRKLGPMMAELKERYGDDRQKMSQELMKLYKKEKVNPLGGCLPILVQMPVFLALYWVLMESVELRHAPFVAWIVDLSVKDPFFVLPLLMGATMFIQFKLNPTPPDPTQAKIMQMMPIVFTVLFLWFPAGLVLYWLTNNALSILQQWYITRKIEAEPPQKS